VTAKFLSYILYIRVTLLPCLLIYFTTFAIVCAKGKHDLDCDYAVTTTATLICFNVFFSREQQ